MKGVFQKIAALALLLLAISPLLFVAQSTFASYRVNAEEVVARAELYDRLRAIAKFHETAPVDAAPSADLPAVLFGKGTPAVLSAGLQAELRQMAAGLGVDIIQVGELQPRTVANFQQIGVRLEMSGPLQGVHKLLQQVGAHAPWLFTENVEIRAGFDESFASPTEPPLYVALDIWGLAVIEKTANAAAAATP